MFFKKIRRIGPPVCCVCKSNFSYRDRPQCKRFTPRYPLVLQCGHSACSCCVRTAAKSNQEIRCNQCHVTTMLDTNNPEVRPMDIFSLGLSAASKDETFTATRLHPTASTFVPLRSRMTPSKPLGMCGECNTTPAFHGCEECNAMLCSRCFKHIHERVNILKDHKMIGIEELIMKRNLNQKDGPSTPVSLPCSYCSILGDERSHEVCISVEKNPECVEEAKALLPEVRRVCKQLQRSNMELLEIERKRLTDCRTIGYEIEAVFRQIHGILQLREHELLMETEQKFNKEGSDIESLKQVVKQYQTLTTTLKTDCQKAAQNPKLVYGFGNFLHHLKIISDLPCRLVNDLDDGGSGDLTSANTFTVDESSLNNLRTIGTVVDNDSDVKYQLARVSPDDDDENTSDGDDVDSDSDLVLDEANNVSSASSLESPSVPVQAELLKRDLVIVKHILHPGEFFVHRKSIIPNLNKLNAAMKSWCNVTKPEPIDELLKGDLVLGQYTTDDIWYRARVIEVLPPDIRPLGDTKLEFPNERRINVLYIDYGNSEVLPVSRLRQIPEKFLAQSEMAVKCALFDIVPCTEEGWLTEAVHTFVDFTKDKILQLHVLERTADTLYVDLRRQGATDVCLTDVPVSVREALVFLQLACFATNQSTSFEGTKCAVRLTEYSESDSESDLDDQSLAAIRRSRPTMKFFNAETPKIGSTLDVIVSFVEDPSSFYIQQVGDCAEYIAAMTFKLQETYNQPESNKWKVYMPSVGLPCVVRYSTDKNWYRVRVLAPPENQMVLVFYVDYGNAERVNWKSLRKIKDVFLQLPEQAIHCSLAHVAPLTQAKSWPSRVNRVLNDYILNKRDTRMFIKGMDIDKLEVMLYQVEKGKHICINGYLVHKGFAASTGSCSARVEFSRSESPDQSGPIIEYNAGDYSAALAEHSIVENQARLLAPFERFLNGPFPELPSLQAERAVRVKVKKPEVSGKVKYVESPSFFYFQQCPGLEVEELMQEMSQRYKLSKVDPEMKWNVGDVCSIQHVKDKMWYRGSLVDVKDDIVSVFLMDFGDTLTDVSLHSLRVMDPEDEKLEPKVVRCHLGKIHAPGDKGTWPSVACETFIEMVTVKGKFILETLGLPVDGSLPVDLEYEEFIPGTALEPGKKVRQSLSTRLLDRGLALPVRMKEVKPKILNGGPADAIENDDVSVGDSPRDSTDWNLLGPLLESPRMESVSSCVGTPIGSLSPKREDLVRILKPWKSPVVPNRQSFEAKVTYVDHSGLIHLHPLDAEPLLEEIKLALASKYDDSEPETHDAYWYPGQSCIAQFSMDKGWYRGTVAKAHENEDDYSVTFIDYGNSECTRFVELRKKLFCTEHAQQCLSCQLVGIEPDSKDGNWTLQVLNMMHRLVVDKTVTVTLKGFPQKHYPLQVEIKLPTGSDLASMLVEIGHARQVETHSSPSSAVGEWLSLRSLSLSLSSDGSGDGDICCPYSLCPLPDEGDLLSVGVTYVSPMGTELYIQRRLIEKPETKFDTVTNVQMNKLLELHELINNDIDKYEMLDNPKRGAAICAWYQPFQKWYRAVLESERPPYEVLFVDYGNRSELPAKKIRVLPEELVELPMQAIHCQLHQVSVKSNEGRMALRALFANLVDTTLLALIKDQNCEGAVKIDVLQRQVGGQELGLAYQELIDRNLISLIREKNLDEVL